MVIMFLAFATILVTNLAYSTFLQSESVGMIKHQLQSEYILKSLINYAAELIHKDSFPKVDCLKETWGPFADGLELPEEVASYLGVNPEEEVSVALQITPLNGRLAINNVWDSTNSNLKDRFQEIFLRLFKNLGFDDDDEVDHTGLFPNTKFRSAEMLGNLIDYLDLNEESFSGTVSGETVKGIEGDLPEKFKFPHEEKNSKNGIYRINSIEDLTRIPGFTPNRIKALADLINFQNNNYVNVNIAQEQVLMALHDDLDSGAAESIKKFTETDYFTDGGDNSLSSIFDEVSGVSGLYSKINTLISAGSKAGNSRFEVIARVAYPHQARRFMTAIIEQDSGNYLNPPQILNPVIY